MDSADRVSDKTEVLFELRPFQVCLAWVLRIHGMICLVFGVFLLTLSALVGERFWIPSMIILGGLALGMVTALFLKYSLELRRGPILFVVSERGIYVRRNRICSEMLAWDKIALIEGFVDEKEECVFLRIVPSKGKGEFVGMSAHVTDVESMLAAIERVCPKGKILRIPARERAARVAMRLLKFALGSMVVAFLLWFLTT